MTRRHVLLVTLAQCVTGCLGARYPRPSTLPDPRRHEQYLIAAEPRGAGYLLLERRDAEVSLWRLDHQARDKRRLELDPALAESLASAWPERARVVELVKASPVGEEAERQGLAFTAPIAEGTRCDLVHGRYLARNGQLTLADRDTAVELQRLPSAPPLAITWVGTAEGELAGLEAVYETGVSTRAALRIVPDQSLALLLSRKGFLAHRAGKTDEAIAYWERSRTLDPRSPTTVYDLACAHAVRGDSERALLLLAEAVALGGRRLQDWARSDPDFRALRESPEFSRLVSPQAVGQAP